MSKRAVSLSNELTILMDATRGIEGLTRRWIESNGMLDGQVPDTIAAILVLVFERLRLVDRVVRGTVDPRLVLCPQNQALPAQQGDEGDVLLIWSEAERARHHRRELKRSRSRLKHERSRRKERAT